jgi:hypothetical protein
MEIEVRISSGSSAVAKRSLAGSNLNFREQLIVWAFAQGVRSTGMLFRRGDRVCNRYEKIVKVVIAKRLK